MENEVNSFIEKAKAGNYDLSVGSVLSETWRQWKKNFSITTMGTCLLLLLTSLATSFFAQITGATLVIEQINEKMQAVIGGEISWQVAFSDINNLPDYAVILKLQLLILLIGVILSPLKAGVINAAKNVDIDNQRNLKDLIVGFSDSKFFKLILVQLFYYVLLFLGIMTFGFPLLYIVPLMTLVSSFIIFNDFSIADSFRCSMAVVNKNFASMFIFVILGGIGVYVLGNIFFGFVGIFTYSFYLTLVYVIYKRIFLS